MYQILQCEQLCPAGYVLVATPECLSSSGCFHLQKEAAVAAPAAGEGDNESSLASSIGCQHAKKDSSMLILAADEDSMVAPEPILFLEVLVT